MMIENFPPPFIIIGMHRSGTSFLSRTLHANGVFMGYSQSINAEATYFRAINEKLLHQNGYSWYVPNVPKKIDNIQHSNFKFLIRYLGFPICYHTIKEFITHKHIRLWGWKDPRNTFTLPFWLKQFPKAKVIYIYRNGMDVAISLYKRNKKMYLKESNSYIPYFEDIRNGLDLWEQYCSQAISYEPLLDKQMITIQFEKIIAGDLIEIERLEEFIQKPLKSYFFETSDKNRTKRFLSEEYKELLAYAQKSDLMKTLGYL